MIQWVVHKKDSTIKQFFSWFSRSPQRTVRFLSEYSLCYIARRQLIKIHTNSREYFQFKRILAKISTKTPNPFQNRKLTHARYKSVISPSLFLVGEFTQKSLSTSTWPQDCKYNFYRFILNIPEELVRNSTKKNDDFEENENVLL